MIRGNKFKKVLWVGIPLSVGLGEYAVMKMFITRQGPGNVIKFNVGTVEYANTVLQKHIFKIYVDWCTYLIFTTFTSFIVISDNLEINSTKCVPKENHSDRIIY